MHSASCTGAYRDRLWAVAVRTLGDPEEAADALQDAMIGAVRRADSFRSDSAFPVSGFDVSDG
jgi:RNA polymerase sigma-70 factor (ECF subfamily)